MTDIIGIVDCEMGNLRSVEKGFEKAGAGVENGSRFYFVHSYYCDPESPECVVGSSPYGLKFASAIGERNVWGVQFHPEKSSMLGLRVLENFTRMMRKTSG